jgi:hypothetical protein
MKKHSGKHLESVSHDEKDISSLIDDLDASVGGLNISNKHQDAACSSAAAAASQSKHEKGAVVANVPHKRDVCALHEAFRSLKTCKATGETVTDLIENTFSGDRWKLVPSQFTRRIANIVHGKIKGAYKHKFYADNNGYVLEKPREILAVHEMGSLMMKLITEIDKLPWIILRTEYPVNSTSISGLKTKNSSELKGRADCILYDYSFDCLVVLDWKCTCDVNSWHSLSQIEGMHKLRAYYQTVIYSYMLDELIKENEKKYPVLEGLRCDVCAVYSVALDTLTDSMTTLCMEAFHANFKQRSSLLFDEYGYRMLKPVFPGVNPREEEADKLMSEVMPLLVKNRASRSGSKIEKHH